MEIIISVFIYAYYMEFGDLHIIPCCVVLTGCVGNKWIATKMLCLSANSANRICVCIVFRRNVSRSEVVKLLLLQATNSFWARTDRGTFLLLVPSRRVWRRLSSGARVIWSLQSFPDYSHYYFCFWPNISSRVVLFPVTIAFSPTVNSKVPLHDSARNTRKILLILTIIGIFCAYE